MSDKKGGGRRSNVVQFADYQMRKRKVRVPKEPPVASEDFDEASRDFHAAASSALKMIFMARRRLGLPDL